MITYEDGKNRIRKVEYLTWCSQAELSKLKALDQSLKLQIVVPEIFKGTKKISTAYKIGFLRTFLKALYPEESYENIAKIMRNRYEVLLGKRQIERYVKEYESNDRFK